MNLDGYRLVWAEEFDKDGGLDASKWSFDTGARWHNEEKQAYTDRLDNAFVSGGMLHIRAKCEELWERSYTSARLHTYGKASWQYGYFEIRAKLPGAVGSWPAFWFMPDASRRGLRWPNCGEIDMMEHTMLAPEELVYSLHCEKCNHTLPHGPYRSTSVKAPGVTREFNTYGMEWTRDYIAYFLNEREVCRYTRQETDDFGMWPFDQPFYLIINTAIGGTMGGEICDTDFPSDLIVDYVRVYQV